MIPLPPLPKLTFTFEVKNATAFEPVNGPELATALRSGALFGAEWIRGLWIRVAQQLDIRHSGAYLRGIQDEGRIEVEEAQQVTTRNGLERFQLVIAITNSCPHASLVEEGHSAFSLPAVIKWGAMGGRIKRTKEGLPYLHVAFRHGAYAAESARVSGGYTVAARKAMMPEQVYQQAKDLQYRQRLHQGPIRQAGFGTQFIAADRYAWERPHDPSARRLDRSGSRPVFFMGGPGAENAGGPGEPGWTEHRSARFAGRDRGGNTLVNPAWQASKFHGLFKAGTKGHTEYLTVRTITPNSPGWNIPALEGRHVARKVADYAAASPKLQEIIEEGIRNSLGGTP